MIRRIFDVGVDSDLALPELPSGEPPVTVTVRRGQGRPPRPAPADGHDATDADEWCRVEARDGHWVLEFLGGVTFVVERDPVVVRYHSHEGVAPETLRHLLLDDVLPRALSLTGVFVLHGSAVVTRYGALVLLGVSGQGKSTLAGAFARSGRPLLADDGVIVRPTAAGWVATASYPGMRLYPRSVEAIGGLRAVGPVSEHTTKLRYGTATLATQADPHWLGGLLSLQSPPADHPDRLAVEEMGPTAKVKHLLDQAFALPGSIADFTAQLDAAVLLAEEVPMAQLLVPRDLTRLDELQEAATAWLARSAGPSRDRASA